MKEIILAALFVLGTSSAVAGVDDFDVDGRINQFLVLVGLNVASDFLQSLSGYFGSNPDAAQDVESELALNLPAAQTVVLIPSTGPSFHVDINEFQILSQVSTFVANMPIPELGLNGHFHPIIEIRLPVRSQTLFLLTQLIRNVDIQETLTSLSSSRIEVVRSEASILGAQALLEELEKAVASKRKQIAADLRHAIRNLDVKKAIEIIMSCKKTNDVRILNMRNHDGQTPLHLAVDQNLYDVVVSLVENGANINLTNRQKVSAAELAVILKRKTLCEFFRQKNVEIDFKKLENLKYFQPTPRNLQHKPSNPEDFLPIIENYLSGKKKRSLLIYAYPLLMNDEGFFTRLINFADDHKEAVIAVLIQLVDEEFPNGRPSLAAKRALALLLEKLGLSKLQGNRIEQGTLAKTPRARSVTLPSPRILVISNGMAILNEREIAYAIAKRNQDNFRVISFKEIYVFLNHQDKAINIHVIGRQADETTKWVALQILSGRDLEEQEKIAQKFVTVAQILLDLKDFAGVFQVACAFCKFEIERLKILPAKSKELKKIMAIASPDGNFRTYRDMVKGLKATKPMVPCIPVLLADLTHAFEGLKEKEIPAEKLVAVARILADLHEMRRRPNFIFSVDQSLLCLMNQLPDVQDESILEEFSEIHKPGVFGLQRNNGFAFKLLEEWTAQDLASCLIHFDSGHALKPLFLAGLYSGIRVHDFIKVSSNSLCSFAMTKEAAGFLSRQRNAMMIVAASSVAGNEWEQVPPDIRRHIFLWYLLVTSA